MSIEKNTPNFLKHSKSPFTTILNKTIQAIKDPAALGIYVYLASKPEDWQISKTNLKNHFGKGEEFIDLRMSYLKSLGLLKSIAIKDEVTKKIIRWETILFNEIHEATKGLDEDKLHNPEGGKTTPLEKPPSWKNPPPTHKRIKEIKEITNKPPKPPSGTSERFDEFWNLYPVKASKKTCLEKWRKLRLDTIADNIFEKLQEQLDKDDGWKRGYIPNPLTYINQQKWDDDIKFPQKNSGNSLSNFLANQNKKGVVIDVHGNEFDPFSDAHCNY